MSRTVSGFQRFGRPWYRAYTQQGGAAPAPVCSITLSGDPAIPLGYNPMTVTGQAASYTLASPANVWLAAAAARSKPTTGSILAEVKVSGTGGGGPQANIADSTFAYRIVAGRNRVTGKTTIGVVSAGALVYSNDIDPASKIALGVNSAGDPLIFVNGAAVDLGGAGAGMFAARDFGPVCIDLEMQTSGTGSVEWITAGANFEAHYIGAGLRDFCGQDTVPVGRLWTPEDTTTLRWFNSRDLSTIIESAGFISQWSDKSGNNGHFTSAIASQQPQISADGVDFDGDDILFQTSPGLGLCTIFTVMKTAALIFIPMSSSVAAYSVVGQQGATSTVINREVGTPSYYVNGAQKSWVSGTTSRDEVYTALSTDKNVLLEMGNADLSTWGNLALGYTPGSTVRTFNIIGTFVEVIVAPPNLSSAQRQIFEGYMMHAAGVASDLPVDHPYKLVPPVVPV